MKAMILAAGRGERLRPLTDCMPKSLLMIGNFSLIEHNILQLRAAGIRQIVINVCYLAEQIVTYLGDGSRYGVAIQYSWERDGCLGTGGGIYHALPLLGDEPFWLVSADVWSEFPFAACQLPAGSDAHLIMVQNPSFNPTGDYGLTAEGRLVDAEPKFTYASFAILHPRLFQSYTSGVYPITKVLNPAMAKGRVSGQLYAGLWFNVGTETELNQLRKTVGVEAD